MKHLRKSAPAVLILMASCSIGKLQMMIDPSLEMNSAVYEVTRPFAFSEKMYNISFGPYRVTGAASGWTTTKGMSLSGFSFLGADNLTGAKKRTSLAHTYQFAAGDQAHWDVQCALLANKSELKNASGLGIEKASSYYTCQYTREGSEPWVLSIVRDESFDLDVRMTNGSQLFTANATKGASVKSNGSSSELFMPADTGYTWTQASSKIAAVSVRENTKRIWLGDQNSDATNEILSMASAGLLIYYMKIEPTLEAR